MGPVIGLDIDGTCGNYHAHFIQFAGAWLGRALPSATAYTGGVPFNEYLGIGRATYNRIKLAYRQGGLKRSMPVYPGIGDFTRYVRSQGVGVWICTTRPYLNLSNIDPDTRHWVTHRAHMQYDGLLYGPYKFHDLVNTVGYERVVAVYDDLPRHIEQASGLGLAAYMRRQPYNEGSGIVNVVGSVDDMKEAFDIEYKIWREQHGST
jgi:hypothetical protein